MCLLPAFTEMCCPNALRLGVQICPECADMQLFDYEHLKLVYLAYPFGGNPDNLEDAEFLVALLSEIFDAVFWAPWIPACRYWQNEGNSLERGLLLDKHAVKMSCEIWFGHHPLSKGMQQEYYTAVENNIFCDFFQDKNDIISLCENPDSDRARIIKERLRNAVPYCVSAREKKLIDENQALRDQIELIEKNRGLVYEIV